MTWLQQRQGCTGGSIPDACLCGKCLKGLKSPKSVLIHSHFSLHKLNWSHWDKKDVLIREKATEEKAGILEKPK